MPAISLLGVQFGEAPICDRGFVSSNNNLNLGLEVVSGDGDSAALLVWWSSFGRKERTILVDVEIPLLIRVMVLHLPRFGGKVGLFCFMCRSVIHDSLALHG